MQSNTKYSRDAIKHIHLKCNVGAIKYKYSKCNAGKCITTTIKLKRCKIQHICNVIQNVIGNAGAMKYNDIKCNTGAIENVLSGILAAAVEPVYRPTLRLLVFVNHNITFILHPNHFDHCNYRVSQKSEFCRIEHLQIGVSKNCFLVIFYQD